MKRRSAACGLTAPILAVVLAAGPGGRWVMASDATEATADACQDGLDNDVDGLFDCDDPDCGQLRSCVDARSLQEEAQAVLAAVHVGEHLEIDKLSGGRLQGRALVSPSRTLDVDVDGRSVAIDASDVLRIRAARGDRGKVGMALGALAGGGLGVLLGKASWCETGCSSGDWGITIGIASGATAAAGFLIGSRMKMTRVIYERPSSRLSLSIAPLLDRHTRGAVIVALF